MQTTTLHIVWTAVGFILFGFLFAPPVNASGACAISESDTLRSAVHYQQGRAHFGSWQSAGQAAVDSFAHHYHAADVPQEVIVSASASPEGRRRHLTQLAGERAAHLAAQLTKAGIPSHHIIYGRSDLDWWLLRDSVAAHPDMPGQRETLIALDSIIALAITPHASRPHAITLRQPLTLIAGGAAWRYMYSRFFPAMRYARFAAVLPAMMSLSAFAPSALPCGDMGGGPRLPDSLDVAVPAQRRRRNVYLAVRTNLLHDLIAVPNIGVELLLGKGYTLCLDYSGAWWGNHMNATYTRGRHVWRYEGGNVELRRYFGSAAAVRPFAGWHLGIYGQCASYDFQWGDTGKQGRKPSWGGGVSLGWQTALARRWNLDLSIAAGYFGGEYKTCRYRDGHNVWVRTQRRHYVGPTRAEVTLVWLWGRGNVNFHKAKSFHNSTISQFHNWAAPKGGAK